MTEDKLARINELARTAKQRDLTAQELSERALLRAEYLKEWREGAKQVLDNTYILTPDGKKQKLKRKDEK